MPEHTHGLVPRMWMLPTVALVAGVAATAQDHPPAVNYLIQSGVTVERQFPAPSGMTGYVITFQGKPNVMYLTPDKEHVIIGVMLDGQGRNLTQDQLAANATAIPDYGAVWQSLEQAHWVAEGAKEPKSLVYVVADPYCPYCHALWKASQPYQAAGLQTRWVLVGYLHPDSEATAAAILGAEDPELALKLHQTRLAEGGLAAEQAPSPQALEQVRANTDLMENLAAVGTPVVVYQDPEGQAQLLNGMPKLGSLPEIFRLPEQPLEDPTLERFR